LEASFVEQLSVSAATSFTGLSWHFSVAHRRKAGRLHLLRGVKTVFAEILKLPVLQEILSLIKLKITFLMFIIF